MNLIGLEAFVSAVDHGSIVGSPAHLHHPAGHVKKIFSVLKLDFTKLCGRLRATAISSPRRLVMS